MPLSARDHAVQTMVSIVFTPSDAGTRIQQGRVPGLYFVYWSSATNIEFRFDVTVGSELKMFDSFRIRTDNGAIEFVVRFQNNKWTLCIDDMYFSQPKKEVYIDIATLAPIFRSTQQTSVCDLSYRQSNGIPSHILHLATGSAGTYASILGEKAYPKTFRIAQALREHAGNVVTQRIKPHTSEENILRNLQSRLARIPEHSIIGQSNQAALKAVRNAKSLNAVNSLFKPWACFSENRPLVQGPLPTWVPPQPQTRDTAKSGTKSGFLALARF